MAHARSRHVGDGRRLGHADAEHATRRARVARSDTYENAGRAGSHEVQCRLIARAPAHDDRHFELTNELLQVERLGRLRDVLRRNDRALNDQDVETRVDDRLGHPRRACRGYRRRRNDARILHLLDALRDELELDRL